MKFVNRRIAEASRDDVIRNYLTWCGGARALTVWLLYTSGEHEQLLDLKIDPLWFNDHKTFRSAYLATELLSKAEFLKTSIDTKAAAVQKSKEAEQHCYRSNDLIRSSLWNISDEQLASMRREVRTIVGKIPDVQALPGYWTKGRTSDVSGCYTGAEKFCSPDVSQSALPLALREVNGPLCEGSLWGQSLLKAEGPCCVLASAFNIVNHNTLITVPKNSKTDRSICYEPTMNIWLQRKVGVYLRDRLRLKTGINIRNQSENQRLCRIGSRDGRFSTIDLSSASDTLCIAAVVKLLPRKWLYLLDSLRSKATQWPDGSITTNEKFSSMGNGFTFELMTIVFYAICKVITHAPVIVYGDDIVVASNGFKAAISALHAFGFIPNERKSHSDSPFRESCGAHYFAGYDVTPIYLRSFHKISDVVVFHNSLVRLYDQCTLAMRLRRQFPFYEGSDGYGDGVYVTPPEVWMKHATRVSNPKSDFYGWEGFRVKSYQEYRKGIPCPQLPWQAVVALMLTHRTEDVERQWRRREISGREVTLWVRQ